MTSVVELKTEVLLSNGFVTALSRLAECRILGAKDHMAVVRLIRLVKSKSQELNELRKVEGADTASKLNETVGLQGCTLTNNAAVQAKLSPNDVLAIEELLEKKVE